MRFHTKKMEISMIALILCISLEVSQGARILEVFPYGGKSHFIMFEPIMKALAHKGHEVTIITHFPIKSSLPNLENIDLTGTMGTPFPDGIPVDLAPGEELNIAVALKLVEIGITTCESVLSSKPIQDLLQSNRKFDLVFYELFNADCFLGFVHKFKTLSIALSSSTFMPWASSRFGVPDNPSFVANHFSGHSDEMNFWQRLWNTVQYGLSNIGFSVMSESQNYEIAKKYFGEDLPPLSELAKNTSLFLVNTHFALNQVRPVTPNVVEVGGIHIQSEGKLSKELQKFLDDSKDGVVYFSLGSTVRGASLSPEKRDAFIEAFRGLPQRVLWKWEDDNIPNKPANVMISKWTSQTAVLAHPNVKAFITHGGLLGTLEATHYGVPMISIPLLGDQYQNVAMGVRRGIAVKLPFNKITVETVKNALNTVIKNSSYQEQATIVSRTFQDRPHKPVDTALFWIEYVLRHNGAKHLQSQAVNLTFVQYLLLDVIAVLSFCLICTPILLIVLVRRVCRRNTQSTGKSKQLKEKHS